ncbi:MAG: amino acid adenylation domain-containing protein [Pseudomonadota bacterium]
MTDHDDLDRPAGVAHAVAAGTDASTSMEIGGGNMFGPSDVPSTLPALLTARANAEPDRIGFTFLTYRRGETPEVADLSYGALLARATAIGARLQANSDKGDRALILCPPGLDYIAAFFACQIAGVIAVPAYPPRNARHMGRLELIAADAGAAAVLAPSEAAGRLTGWATAALPLVIGIDSVNEREGLRLSPPTITLDDLSFLQYTSGTTGTPKGVMVSHANVMANTAAIRAAWQLDPSSSLCLWLPPYHDMGLINGLVLPLYVGSRSVLLTSGAFLQRPLRWFAAMAAFRATHTIAPNFAWQLSVETIADRQVAALDLSCLRSAASGAETIRRDTVEAVASHLAPAGLKADRLDAAYGLAEAVVIAASKPAVLGQPSAELAQSQRSAGAQAGRAAPMSGPVPCGQVIAGHGLRIVDPHTHRTLPDGSTGEIWLTGPSVAQGYWNKPEETQATFRAQLADTPQGGQWLRTGDLGTLVDGELYVLGRIKEMIIVRGLNHYATDIEATAEAADPILGRDRTVAFAVEHNDEEQLVLIHELTRASLRTADPVALTRAMRRAVLDVHEIDVAAIAFLKPARLPRTTSGKLQRGAARNQWRDGTLDPVAQWSAANEAVLLFDRAIAERLGASGALPERVDVERQLRRHSGVGEADVAYRLHGDGVVGLEVMLAPAPVPAAPELAAPALAGVAVKTRAMRFGLFFFGSDAADTDNAPQAPRYDLLLTAAERADAAGLDAIWTPERHFGVFGGQYPSPVATSAALAARTKQIAIRAGSVVLPLHHPIRVAEDWAVIDNLSGGRAGVSFASGWHQRDFVLAPGGHAERKGQMLEAIDTVRALWRGEEATFSDGTATHPIRIRPLPVQDEIPIWLTAASSAETFLEAGRRGFNVLTFLAQSAPHVLAARIESYRAAYTGSDRPHVSAMVHTFLAPTTDAARTAVADPMRRYIIEATDLARSSGLGAEVLGPAADAMVDNAVAQFLDTRGLFGTPRDALARVLEWQALGIDEIACLIDFGLPAEQVLAHLDHIFELNDLASRVARERADPRRGDEGNGPERRLALAFPDVTGPINLTWLPLGAAWTERARFIPREVGTGSPPRTATEQLVASAFAMVLERDAAQRETHFFDAGGHSLLVARLIARLEDAMGKHVPISLVFKAPTVAELAAALDDTPGTAAWPLVRATDRSRPIPASFQQERLWFLDQLDPRAGRAYNEVHGLKLSGSLDAQALTAAITAVVGRHDALRTTLASREGTLTQTVAAHDSFEVVREDWSESPPEAATARAAALCRAPFDLSGELLFRAALLRRGPQDHILILGGHHTIRDGWSDQVILREISALYREAVSGTPAALPPLPIQYADYAVWQRDVLSGERLTAQTAWWRANLAGIPEAITLPTDRPRPQAMDYRGGSVPMHVPADVTTGLKALARSEGATLFMVLEAAFAALLSRLGAGQDVLIGTATAGRPRAELEPLVGFFVNTLVLRHKFDRRTTFREHLAATKAVVLDAFAHQAVPFEAVVETLAPTRSLSHPPVVQVMLVLQNAAGAPTDLALPDVLVTPLQTANGAGAERFELTLHLADTSEGLQGSLSFATQLFDTATAARIAAIFGQLVAAAAASPNTPLVDLPLLDAAGRHQVVTTFNNTASVLPTDETVLDLFANQVAARTEAVAVVDWGHTLTYAALEEASNRFARHLIAQGAGPERIVGVCLPWSTDLIITILAIWKAGGTYLPLDPGYPQERIGFMLDDAGASVLVATTATVDSIYCGHNRQLVLVDEITSAGSLNRLSALPLANGEVQAALSEQTAAYVVYTSGSTGRPKGVIVAHRSLMSFLSWATQTGRPGRGPRMLMRTPIGFDSSFRELLLPLATGGSLHAAPANALRTNPHMIEGLGIDSLNVVPAFLDMVLSTCTPEWLATLRYVYCGGDTLAATARSRAIDHLPSARLIHGYGPSEATCNITAETFQDGQNKSGVSIGTPVANSTVYIVDEQLAPVPVGIAGELLIGGVQVSRGYLGRPGLTAATFIADPFSERAGARLYKTGDLARWRPDGTLEFLGRIDAQVKIRGMRVEPGEIEAALTRLDGVAQAAVVARSHNTDPQLVAYVVPTSFPDTQFPGIADADPEDLTEAPRAGVHVLGDDCLDLEAVGSALRQTLPEHMVPTGYVVLSRLPLTPSGKVDREALPNVDVSVARPAYDAPLTAMEALVAAAFAEVVGVKRVGRQDDFFALGGHSLMAVRLAARLEAATGKALPLRTLFEASVVAALAKALENAAKVDGYAPLVPISAGEFEPFAMTDVQAAYYVGRQGVGEVGNASCFSFTALAFPSLDVQRLEQVLDELIAVHPMLRAVFAADLTQRVLDRVPAVKIPVTDLSNQTPDAAETAWMALVDSLSNQTLPADRWPLFDVHAVKMPGQAWRFTFGIDLLICDAVSLGLIAQQLFGRYFGTMAPLTAPTLTFRDVVLHRDAHRQSPHYARAAAYWQDRLATLPTTPQLPLTLPPDRLVHRRFERRKMQLDPTSWGRLKGHAARHGLTPTSALVTAYGAVLATWSTSDDLLINLTVMDRKPLHPQIGDVVGDFTTISLLAVERARTGPFGARAARNQARLLADLDHLDYTGVEVLRALVATGRTPGTAHVVFTSTLGAEAADEALTLAAEHGVELLVRAGQTPQVLLDCQVSEGSQGLSVVWDAPGALYPDGLLDDMFSAYRALLETLSETAEAWADPLPAPLPPWQGEVIALANTAQGPLPMGRLHDAVFAQAATRPNAPALVGLESGGDGPDGDGSDTLSFGALCGRASVLAALIQAALANSQSGDDAVPLVALVMEKGWEEVVAALAVLEAGAAFLPVSADQPDARISAILSDADVVLVLTVPALSARVETALASLKATTRPVVQCVDAAAVAGPPPVRSDAAAAAAQRTTPQTTAYVIYTSGSTGQPKGVVMSHRAAMNTLHDLTARFDLGADDRVLWVSELSFDLSVFDLFGVLGAGGAVVLPAAGSREDPARWVERVATHKVTVWNSVPQLADMATSVAGPAGDLSGLRLMMLSGDWVPVTLPDRVRALAPACAVYSLGGATEAAIWSILYPVGVVDPDWTSIPYGKALTNQSFHVLGEDLSPAPVHVPGRLFIGGVGLADGYRGDAGKTAKRFIPHPKTGERLYDTGDLGRMLPCGDIVFLGRADFQVKIRGHRVELGEIEAALMAHPDVESAIAVATGERDNKQIAAYVVAKSQADAWDPEDASLIQAPSARAAFTLAGHGRPTPGTRPAVPLPGGAIDPARQAKFVARQSYRTFEGATLDKARLEAWLAEGCASVPSVGDTKAGPVSLSMDDLSALTGALQAMAMPDALLAKRLYASAGGLYPVRAYLVAGDGAVTGLAAGAYVYDPLDHALIPIEPPGSLGGEAGLQIVLLGHLPAIAPLYGSWAGIACTLEAGGMVHALAAEAQRCGLAIASSAADAQTLAARLGLAEPETDIGIAALVLSPRASGGSRLFEGCAILIDVKPGAVPDVAPGVYRYDPALGLCPTHSAGLPGSALQGPNRAIHAAAALSLALLPPAGAPEQTALLAMGVLAQGFAEAGVTHRIGSCPVGGVRPDALRTGFDLPSDENVLPYVLLAGPVSAAQQINWRPAQLKAADPRDPLGGRSWLAQRLPAPMIPTALTLLNRLPLTPTGKVDRKALPAPNVSVAPTVYAVPEGETETLVATAFAQVLGADRVGRHDSFFELGGHSLTAARLVDQLKAKTGKTLAIRELFERPTVADVANAISQIRLDPTDDDVAMLLADPSLAEEFDELFGAGSSSQFLGASHGD